MVSETKPDSNKKKREAIGLLHGEKGLARIHNRQSVFLLLVIGLVLLSLSVFVPDFATARNIWNLLVQVAPIGTMAFGISYVMITGGIDVSSPAVMATAAVIGASYMAKTGDLIFGPFLMLIVGAALGAINGFAVAKLRMVALVVTLATMTICTGIAAVWTKGQSVVGLSPAFSTFFNSTTVLIIFTLLFLTLNFVLARTLYGRWLYLIGTNQNAARMSGLPTVGATFSAYMVSGVCAGVAAIMNTSALSSARPNMGPDTQIVDIVCAAVIGGVAISGGSGKITGVLLGAVLIMMVNNIINLAGVPDYFTSLIKGVIIVLAVGLDRLRTKSVG